MKALAEESNRQRGDEPSFYVATYNLNLMYGRKRCPQTCDILAFIKRAVSDGADVIVFQEVHDEWVKV